MLGLSPPSRAHHQDRESEGRAAGLRTEVGTPSGSQPESQRPPQAGFCSCFCVQGWNHNLHAGALAEVDVCFWSF